MIQKLQSGMCYAAQQTFSNTRSALSGGAITFLILLLVGFWVPPRVAGEDTSERPNILFILTDDQSPQELDMYAPDTKLDTPVLDRLASEGMVIDGAHHMGSWSPAVCKPSRRMIMSGRTLWHTPGGGNPHSHDQWEQVEANPDLIPSDLPDYSMPAVFNRAGYDTMRASKGETKGAPVYMAANKKFDINRADWRTGPDGSAWYANRVLDYLNERQNAGKDNPFLIYMGPAHPHDTRNGKPELLEKYGAVNHKDKESLPPLNPKAPPLPTNYLPAHPFPHGHPDVRDEVAVEGVWTNRDERTIRNERGRYYATIEALDQQIGRVLQKLERMGELENTYVFFTSDHGIAIGRHGLMGKQNLYEHTWRVPFLVKGPGIEPDSRAQGNIYLLDVLPTMCELAGIPVPDTVEGTSFKPVLTGKRDTVRDVLYGVYAGGTRPGIRSVKKGKWKLIKYDVLNGDVQRTQLFNLEKNPHELLIQHHTHLLQKRISNDPGSNQVNLAHDPQYAEIRKKMEQLLLSEMKRLDDPYRLWDQPKKKK